MFSFCFKFTQRTEWLVFVYNMGYGGIAHSGMPVHTTVAGKHFDLLQSVQDDDVGTKHFSAPARQQEHMRLGKQNDQMRGWNGNADTATVHGLGMRAQSTAATGASSREGKGAGIHMTIRCSGPFSPSSWHRDWTAAVSGQCSFLHRRHRQLCTGSSTLARRASELSSSPYTT